MDVGFSGMVAAMIGKGEFSSLARGLLKRGLKSYCGEEQG